MTMQNMRSSSTIYKLGKWRPFWNLPDLLFSNQVKKVALYGSCLGLKGSRVFPLSPNSIIKDYETT